MGVFDAVIGPANFRGFKQGRVDAGDILKMWIRPTISYKRKCAGKQSRKNFVSLVNELNTGKSDDTHNSANVTFILSIIALSFACCCSIPIIKLGMDTMGKTDASLVGAKAIMWFTCMICGFVVPMAMVISMIFTSNKARNEGDEKIRTLRDLKPFESCLDP